MEGSCEGERPNFVSSNGAQVSFLILCNTSSSKYVSRRTIHFMKNLRLLPTFKTWLNKSRTRPLTKPGLAI
ncbi:hypothetical protein GYH30_049037 [Glycine max]|uniref:Uncharacterized protein n=1 Tax=Glycine max TaxID=3847 RepID=A0A0R0F5I9_SOYBN|nr:hypothetical protein GYH30_049037 [Glycine max]